MRWAPVRIESRPRHAADGNLSMVAEATDHVALRTLVKRRFDARGAEDDRRRPENALPDSLVGKKQSRVDRARYGRSSDATERRAARVGDRKAVRGDRPLRYCATARGEAARS